MTRKQEQFRGCLLGGAVGDALGAPVEFMSFEQIRERFGPDGITSYAHAYGRFGAITDDTQMTLFTAEGLIRAGVRLRERGVCDPLNIIRYSYDRWLATQGERPPNLHAVESDNRGWLFDVPELHSRRAPGNTCLQALRTWEGQTPLQARNSSKGCGGVMRVAPVGLVADDPYELGCETAAITHGHPLGWQSAGAFALLISKLLKEMRVEQAVNETLAELPKDAGELRDLLTRSADTALSDRAATDGLESLGEGWVAEEALAIGIFCSLRANSFADAIHLAVNHGGDSDSTGSVAGQILGTSLGVAAIPDPFLSQLELRSVIQQVADDLYEWFEEAPLEDFAHERNAFLGWWARYPGC